MIDSLDSFTRGFLECALWSSLDSYDDAGGNPLDENYGIEDFAPETLAQLLKDCEAFQQDEAKDLALATEQLSPNRDADSQHGHDFWLTRNGHGAGFWDRGYPDGIGKRLTEASEAYGTVDLYVGDDGKVHA